MAQSDKTIGHGTVYKIGSTAIARVRSITPPTQSRDEADGTTLDSLVKDKIPGDPPDAGEVVLDLVWKPGETNDEVLDTAYKSKTIDTHSIVYPTAVGKTDTFSGWIKSLTPAPIESATVLSRQVTIVLTTAITRDSTES